MIQFPNALEGFRGEGTPAPFYGIEKRALCNPIEDGANRVVELEPTEWRDVFVNIRGDCVEPLERRNA